VVPHYDGGVRRDLRLLVLLGAAFLLVLAACMGTVTDGSANGLGPDGGTGTDGGTGGDGGGPDSGRPDGGAPDAGQDVLLPWENPPQVYARFTHGPSADPSFFPIAVWLQSPSNARAYADIGINTFVGLYQGPTDAQLTVLADAGMPALCDQAGVWASHLSDPTIRGWTQQDEPDNAQPDGDGGYGPCIDPSVIQGIYATFRANDPTRPVYLNLGQGVAWQQWIGRGSACAGRLDMYPQYEQGADIVSFDIYPLNETDPSVKGDLWLVSVGVDRLRQGTSYTKPVWNWIETTGIDDPADTPTPAQIRAEVWMSLVHGSAGIGYFAHIFSPSFIEAGLLSLPTVKAGVKSINAEIASLAPVLNTPSIGNAAAVASQNAAVPVDIMVKRQGGALYVFAVAMRPGATQATFTLRGVAGGTATVLGESRTIPVVGGVFSDAFAADYTVHLYRVTF
jgi:hypothetical protein